MSLGALPANQIRQHLVVRTLSGRRAVKHIVYLVIIILPFVSLIYLASSLSSHLVCLAVADPEEGEWLVRPEEHPPGLPLLRIIWNR